jgi:hypothetical protein
MAGTVIVLWNKRSFNFNNVIAGSSESHVAVKALAVERYREAQLIVRAHTRTIDDTNSMIQIVAQTTAPTAEDPSIDFVSTTASGTATIASGSTTVVATANLSNFGGFLRFNVIGTRTTSGSCVAELSAELVLKE